MLIKVDEDLPNIAAKMLREYEYEAESVVEQGMGGWKDPDLWRVVQAEKRFLVTADKVLPIYASILPAPTLVYCYCVLMKMESVQLLNC